MIADDNKVNKNLEQINGLTFKKLIDKRTKKLIKTLIDENKKLLESGKVSEYSNNCLILNGVSRVNEMMYYIGLENASK